MNDRKLDIPDAGRLRILADRYFEGMTAPEETAELVAAARDLSFPADSPLRSDLEVIGRLESGMAAMGSPGSVPLPAGLEERLVAHVGALAAGERMRRRGVTFRRISGIAASVAALAVALSAGWYLVTLPGVGPADNHVASAGTESVRSTSAMPADTVIPVPARQDTPLVAEAAGSSVTSRKGGCHPPVRKAARMEGESLVSAVSVNAPADQPTDSGQMQADVPEMEQIARVSSSVADAGKNANLALLASLDGIARQDDEVEDVITRNIEMLGSAMRDTQSSLRQASTMIGMVSVPSTRYDVTSSPSDGSEPTDPFDF